jgi:TPR repeat protein
MDKPWFRKLFDRAQATPQPESTQSKADHGDAEAQFSLGLNFANAAGAGRDYSLAADWYLKAANQNHALAQFNLGIMYSRGQGFPMDETKARGWIQRAAQQGDAGAQYELGIRHQRNSLGEPAAQAHESRLEAYKWLHLATSQGYKGSQAAFECVSLRMTHAEVALGNLRVVEFENVARG